MVANHLPICIYVKTNTWKQQQQFHQAIFYAVPKGSLSRPNTVTFMLCSGLILSRPDSRPPDGLGVCGVLEGKFMTVCARKAQAIYPVHLQPTWGREACKASLSALDMASVIDRVRSPWSAIIISHTRELGSQAFVTYLIYTWRRRV